MTTYTLYWVSEDRQSDMNMGDFITREDALNGIPGAKQEIIDQGGDPSGNWEVMESED